MITLIKRFLYWFNEEDAAYNRDWKKATYWAYKREGLKK